MLGFWQREFFKYIIFAAIALVIERIEGWVPALSFLCLALLIGNFFHLNNLNRLTRWLAKPDNLTIPDVAGSWGELSAALYRMVKGSGSLSTSGRGDDRWFHHSR